LPIDPSYPKTRPTPGLDPNKHQIGKSRKLRAQMNSNEHMILDLNEVMLADTDVPRFLGASE